MLAFGRTLIYVVEIEMEIDKQDKNTLLSRFSNVLVSEISCIVQKEDCSSQLDPSSRNHDLQPWFLFLAERIVRSVSRPQLLSAVG